MPKEPKTMPLKLNEVRFNESYVLAAFKDVESLNTCIKDPLNKARIVRMGDRHTIISACQKYRPKGNHPLGSVNMINIITELATKMLCRYDTIKYLALIRK